jgi:hypothetical protein
MYGSKKSISFQDCPRRQRRAAAATASAASAAPVKLLDLLGASIGDFAILPLLNARDLVALARASAACCAAANGADSARPRGAPPPRFRNLRCLSQEHKPCNIL